jgi:sugar lactone lactonase YvrE
MSPNDTVVYVPDAKVAWSGNLVFGDGTIPWAQSGGIATYRATPDDRVSSLEPAASVSGSNGTQALTAVAGTPANPVAWPESARFTTLSDSTR